MPTRSTYGILNTDGTVTSVYCQFDGYVSGVGKDLFEHYNTEEKVRELIAKGACSGLDATLEKSTFYAEIGFDSPSIRTHKTETEFWEYDMVWMEYHYLFKPADGKWYVRIYQRIPVELTQELIAKD